MAKKCDKDKVNQGAAPCAYGETIQRISEQVDHLVEKIIGNGQPGIVTRLAMLEQADKDAPKEVGQRLDRLEQKENVRAFLWRAAINATITLVIGAVAVAAAWLIKHQS